MCLTHTRVRKNRLALQLREKCKLKMNLLAKSNLQESTCCTKQALKISNETLDFQVLKIGFSDNFSLSSVI